MDDYPQAIAPVKHVEPVPRRIRAFLDGRVVVDTTAALYVWEWSYSPQYYLPVADVEAEVLVDEHHQQHLLIGDGRPVRDTWGTPAIDPVPPTCSPSRPSTASPAPSISTGRPSTVGSRRTNRSSSIPATPMPELTPSGPLAVSVEVDGVDLARSSSPVMVFETGLPTRYYFNRTEVNLDHLVPSDTVTSCPYKGTTSAYWSLAVEGRSEPDIAWAYDFPTLSLQPIAGLIAFYNERVDITIDGQPLERPTTHFS